VKTEEVRESFLRFFEKHGHTRVASSSLIPAGDPTLLFANSGMVQFKDCFLGTDVRPYSRATTCQKSLRISGKHNDLENVGRTARHHTLFEMLGNFSFGDYFKQEAIRFAWQFVTEVLQLPKDRLWTTVYEEDDEAQKLWESETDLKKGRVLRFGKDDNFWQMGETGPCGPCSEIFYYLGDNVAGQSEQEFRSTDGLYFEIWNLVFMQFNRDTKGNLTPLPKPSVDTGMGLERVTAVKQGVMANYDIDLFRGIIAKVEQLSGKKYDGRDYSNRDPLKDQQYAADVAMRVIADHMRAICFLLADGVNPSGDGRGYVLRRLLRRATRHGRNLGFNKPAMQSVCAEIIDLMQRAYPELKASKDKILKTVKLEEERFLATLESGLSMLDAEIELAKNRTSKILSGKTAFTLHDTFGFPLDLTEDIARTHGISVDREGFSESMEEQRERSRSARAGSTQLILQRAVKPTTTEFVGYDYDEYESELVAIYSADGEIKLAKEGDEVVVVTKATPFYGESGGQLGDTGHITTNNCSLDVLDTQKVGGSTIVHICKVRDGELSLGDGSIRLTIDRARRNKLRINHSATHILHLALREVLGDEVKQAGSRVSDRSLRFDFTHADTITPAQLTEIQLIAAQEILSNYPVTTTLMSLDDAKRSGATALFGEKYQSEVRVVQIGPRSKELCGGTHASRSGDIGSMVITYEGSISAGVRRIEAVAGLTSTHVGLGRHEILSSISNKLRCSEKDIIPVLDKLLAKERELEREVNRTKQILNTGVSEDLITRVESVAGGVNLLATRVKESDPKELRELSDKLRSKIGSGCILLASEKEGKAVLLIAVTDDLRERYHAGKLMQEVAAVVGSKGGGRPDLAQAGGGDAVKIDDAMKRFRELI
jgi:alanyl-tRNA synthetase